jgi:hypothetical protein
MMLSAHCRQMIGLCFTDPGVSFRSLVALLPKTLGSLQRVDLSVLPPHHFITGLMQLPMMPAAERHGELVTDFEADGPGLGNAQMVRV